ncbi:MAG: putative Transposon Ty3-I Gag-Pol polyprotein [Streblomastix strix]|uniref:Putative Transposon Ty3-I Gag-Pol polyprotein n=1 Tax=Streblomastix strix TaxID=222440 RepID=A0A5J4WN68_9EUKA|nr:MAG: putative Transposon Ty3-I Gag-Pol polyprotein [Streblomastix strix]
MEPTSQQSSQIHQQYQIEPVGGCLINHLNVWEQIGAAEVVKQGIIANWKDPNSPKWLKNNRFIPKHPTSQTYLPILEQLITKDLSQKVIKVVNEKDTKRFNPIFTVPKGKSGKWRRIMDCSLLNEHLNSDHFKMEDIRTLREVAQQQNWAIKIDLTSAFNHIPDSRNLSQYLGFKFQDKCYEHTAMYYGIRHATLTFHSIIRYTLEYIRRTLQIRCLSYCDDLLFLHQAKNTLQQQTNQILRILSEFGWKVSIKKSNIMSTQQFEYLQCFLDTSKNQMSMTKQRRAEMLQQISRWRRTIVKKKIDRIKWWAGLIGKLTFLRLQIRKGGLHMSQMNKQLNQAVKARNWYSWMWINKTVLTESGWWNKTIALNNPIPLMNQQPEAILTTDVSEDLWGATLEILELKREIKLSETWTSKWKLTSSNQRETVAIYLALCRSEKDHKNFKITNLRIQSDNSAAVFNLNHGAAAPVRASLVNKIMEKLESMEMIFTAFHIPGKSNQVADALSRLSTSGDYEIRQEVLQEAQRVLDIK